MIALPSWVPWVGCAVLAIGAYAIYQDGKADLAACEGRMEKFKTSLAFGALEQRAETAEKSAAAAKAHLAEAQQIQATGETEKEKVRVVTIKEACRDDAGVNAMFDAYDRVLEAGAGARRGPDRGGSNASPALPAAAKDGR